ncbi:hypothetical protein LTS08_002229 [Lithohypha guttulata]|uniref:Uncharacterized protein n=1 Tax=Lithohypha guttulata TaxID=1690604 RepID=A0AAN7T8E4_9EURO|nr:hypothetical protein LTR51_004254 [Lithohypha guttulata]KAK5090861.1 hypothetical protein LTR05_001038 [Lithohypha guttulata]KAK5104341.1 hypothetical protein LTS08_002229 [Lithohypha guttulata]
MLTSRLFLRRPPRIPLFKPLYGILGGTAIVTYEYLAPPFERGTEEYQELQEEIEEILDTSPVVEELREHGWFEEPVVPSKTMHVPGDRHLVQDTLTGVQGLTMKQFRHPDQQTASAVVFFAGFGLEGWPDYLHGGAIMSMFKQAYDRHLTPLIKNEGLTLAFNADEDIEAAFDVNSFTFHKPVRPGEIYTVFVFSQGFGTSYNTKTGSSMMVDSAQLILTPGDFMPEIAFHPERVDVNVPENVIHATCLVRVMLDTDRVSKGELGDKRLEQLTAEAKRISEKYESSHKAAMPRSTTGFGKDGG